MKISKIKPKKEQLAISLAHADKKKNLNSK